MNGALKPDLSGGFPVGRRFIAVWGWERRYPELTSLLKNTLHALECYHLAWGDLYNRNVNRARSTRAPLWLDEHAFQTIFNEHYTRVYAVLFRLAGDPGAAADLITKAFWQMRERPPARPEQFIASLYREATRLGYSALQSGGNAGRKGRGMAPAGAAEQPEARERVRRVLRQMPLREVQALALRHAGLTYQEIAAALAVSASAVGALLARAEAHFEALDEEMDGTFTGD